MRRLLAGLVAIGSLAIALTPVTPAGAQTSPSGYSWTADDPALSPVLEYPGSATVPYAGGQFVGTSGVAPSVDWLSTGVTFEMGVTNPTGSQCDVDARCYFLNMRGLRDAGSFYAAQMTFGYFFQRSGSGWVLGVRQSASDTGTQSYWYTGLIPNFAPGDTALVTITDEGNTPAVQRVYVNGVGLSFGGKDIGFRWDEVCLFGFGDCLTNGSATHMAGSLICNARLSSGVLTAADMTRRADAISGGESPCTEMPQDPTSFVPRLSCGRTMRDMGNGVWWADAEAHILNPDVNATDSAGVWRTSWDAQTYTGRSATIPLPADATTRTDLWVSYMVKRTVTQTELIGWDPDVQLPAGSGDWRENIAMYPAPNPDPSIIPGWSWFADEMQDAFGVNLPGGSDTPKGWVTVDLEDDGVGDQLTTKTVVKSVTAGCTVRVAPATAHKDPPLVIININNHPDDPNDGGPDDEPSPTTGDKCNDSAIWKFWDWPDKMLCLLDGIFDGVWDAITGAIGDLLSWLMERFGDFSFDFIGDLVPEWQSKFPLSVLVEASDAMGVLMDSLQASLDGPSSGDDIGAMALTAGEDTSGCGPTVDPNLDERASFIDNLPGGDVSSKLDGFKWSLPSPVYCPLQTDEAQQLADFHGKRAPIRGFLTIALYGGFLTKIAVSFGPKRNGLEPDGIEAPDAYAGRWQVPKR